MVGNVHARCRMVAEVKDACEVMVRGTGEHRRCMRVCIIRMAYNSAC